MDNNLPVISVIIPAYNVENYLGGMLDCVLHQTLQAAEVILVNDGSTDDTQKIIDRYCTENSGRFFSFYEKNSGQSAARNLGIAQAKGEYLAFLDADDLISCEYLEKLYTAAKTENADMAKCSIADFDLTIDNRWEACNITKRTIEFEPGIAVSFHNSPCAGIVRRDFLDRFHIRFSEGEQMEDSPYGILVNLLANHVAIVDETLYYHRVYHSGSTMTKVHEGEKNPNIPYRGMREAAEMLKKEFLSPPKSDIAEYMCINTLASFLTIMYMNYGKKVRYPLCEYCSAYVDDYFPDVVHNPYIFGKKTKNVHDLPLSQRLAVVFFVRSYQMKMLYPFSYCAAFLMRKMGRHI